MHPALAVAIGLCYLGGANAQASSQRDDFSIADYLRVKRVAELAMSPGGERLAYVVESPSLEQDSTIRGVFVQSLERGTLPAQLEGIDGAHALQWISHTRQLAFLSARSGVSQVYSIDVISLTLRQWTHGMAPVTSFVFSPRGDQLAFRTEPQADYAESLSAQLKTSRQGVLVDINVVSILDFLESSANQGASGRPIPADTPRLWIVDEAKDSPIQLPIPGDVQDFFWSSDDQLLSVTYIADNIPLSVQRAKFTSIAIADLKSFSVSVLFKGAPPTAVGDAAGVGYTGGEWIPNQGRILVRRESRSNPWIREHYVDWTVASVLGSSTDQLSWHSMEDNDAKFRAMSSDSFLVENTLRGVQSLFRMNAAGIRRSNIVARVAGSSRLFAFSENLRRLAFVSESLTRPPEINVWEAQGHRIRQLSNLNEGIVARQMPRARKVVWRSTDGTQAEGWLLEPPLPTTAGPRPLLTFVHGGPGMQFSDDFAPYFHLWSYPLEVLPAYGISVFIPNYRGTHGYGLNFSSPSAQDGEPVEDILTGIQQLIYEGVADRDRLAIAGHSHGGWLAAVVMTRAKIFKAGSFAEAALNWVTLYEMMPDLLNRNVHDVNNRASLWETPERYLKMSPDLNFAGVPTASLIETGALTPETLLMFPAAKAASHFGRPVEEWVYPRTGHNVDSPKIQLEIATRNLDWFRFWLLGQEDAGSAKVTQYARWGRMSDAAKQRDLEVRHAISQADTPR